MEGHALLAGCLRRVDPALPAIEQVRAMGRAYYEFGMKHPHYYALMFSVRSTETPRREAVHREMQTLMLLRDVVRTGMDRRELRRDLDVMVATNALWAQIHGLTASAAACPRRWASRSSNGRWPNGATTSASSRSTTPPSPTSATRSCTSTRTPARSSA